GQLRPRHLARAPARGAAAPFVRQVRAHPVRPRGLHLEPRHPARLVGDGLPLHVAPEEVHPRRPGDRRRAARAGDGPRARRPAPRSDDRIDFAYTGPASPEVGPFICGGTMLLPYPDRIPLALTPTPLEPLARLSKRMGVELLCKRDDLTGAPLTGNKVRKLEF